MSRAQGLPLARDEREFLEGVVNAVADPIFVKDREHRFVLLNDAACALIGRKRRELLGRRDHDFFPKEQADVFWRQDELVFKTGRENVNEEALTDAAGEVHVLVTKKTVWTARDGSKYLVGLIRDTTAQVRIAEELKRSRESLYHARKMEVLGRLASGVAHDFNNLLTAMRGCAGLVLEALPVRHPAREEVREIQKAGDRASALTSQLLSFSRRDRGPTRVEDLRDVVSRMRGLLERLLPEGVALHVFLPERPARVRVNSTAVERILLNLLVNAGDAMPSGGRVVIEVRAGADKRAAEKGLRGRCVLLSVRDEGGGMDAGTLERLFDPYFTTKPRGTGIGLSLVRDAVESGGGRIVVDSVPGEGTAFHIWWPEAKAATKPKRRRSRA